METIPEDTHSDTVILKLEEARALFDKLMEKKVSADEASTSIKIRSVWSGQTKLSVINECPY